MTTHLPAHFTLGESIAFFLVGVSVLIVLTSLVAFLRDEGGEG